MFLDSGFRRNDEFEISQLFARGQRGNSMERILIIGANGQIGCELVEALAEKHGAENVIAAVIAPRSLAGATCYETLDVLDAARLATLIDERDVTQLYHLAALLSVTGEQAP